MVGTVVLQGAKAECVIRAHTTEKGAAVSTCKLAASHLEAIGRVLTEVFLKIPLGCCTFLFVHPLSSTYLKSGHSGRRLNRVFQTYFFFPALLSSSFWEILEAFPSLPRDVIWVYQSG